jgi:hypothetical protein
MSIFLLHHVIQLSALTAVAPESSRSRKRKRNAFGCTYHRGDKVDSVKLPGNVVRNFTYPKGMETLLLPPAPPKKDILKLHSDPSAADTNLKP